MARRLAVQFDPQSPGHIYAVSPNANRADSTGTQTRHWVMPVINPPYPHSEKQRILKMDWGSAGANLSRV